MIKGDATHPICPECYNATLRVLLLRSGGGSWRTLPGYTMPPRSFFCAVDSLIFQEVDDGLCEV